MDTDSNAPVVVKAEMHIAADPQTAFGVIMDIGHWPRWNPDVTSVTLLGPPQPGTEFRWKSGLTLISKLRVVDPPTKIGWTGTTTGITAVHVFRFHPHHNGGTLVSSEESWDGLLVGLLRGLSRRALSRSLNSTLTHLKAEAERRASGNIIQQRHNP